MDAPLSTGQVAALLESTAALLEAEVKAVGDDLARWHPAEGEWCVNEVLGHLIEADRRGFSGRIQLVRERERPTFDPWDQAAVAKERKDCERMPQSLLMEFLGLRHEGVALVRSLRPDELARTGTHRRVGVLSIRDLLQEWVHHDRNHTKQLLAVVQARVWPDMGNTQKFSSE